MGKMTTIILVYSNLIFVTIHPSLLFEVFKTLLVISANATLTFDIFAWFACVSHVWQIFKTSTKTCLSNFFVLPPT